MLVGLICGVVLGWVIGHARGWSAGWNDGIKIARHWESSCRDWRMIAEMECAETEAEVTKAYEVRQLKRMYDDV